MNPLSYFFCRIAGVREDALAKHPDGTTLAATTGFSICLTTLLAFFTSAYAAHRALDGDPIANKVAPLVGIVWATVIFVLDRFLITTIDKFAPPAKLRKQFAMRLALATCVGITLSTPIELRVFRSIIDQGIRSERLDRIAAEATQNRAASHLVERENEAKQSDDDLIAQQRRILGDPDSASFRNATASIKLAEQQYALIVARNVPRIAVIQREARSTSDSIKRENLHEAAHRLQAEIAEASSAKHAAERQLEAARRDWNETEQARLVSLTQSAQQDRAARSAAESETAAHDAESEASLNALLRNDLAREYLEFERIKGDRNNPDRLALWIGSLALRLLIILVEVLPVGVKMLAEPTPLDHTINASRLIDIERINLQTISRVAEFQAASAVRDRAVERLRDEQLRTIAMPDTRKEVLTELRTQAENQMAA